MFRFCCICVDDNLASAMSNLTIHDTTAYFDSMIEYTTFSKGVTDAKKVLLNVNLAAKNMHDDGLRAFLEYFDTKLAELVLNNPGKRIHILQARSF